MYNHRVRAIILIYIFSYIFFFKYNSDIERKYIKFEYVIFPFNSYKLVFYL